MMLLYRCDGWVMPAVQTLDSRMIHYLMHCANAVRERRLVIYSILTCDVFCSSWCVSDGC
jgi:hypothetical protein